MPLTGRADQPAAEPDEDHVQQAKGHGRSSCRPLRRAHRCSSQSRQTCGTPLPHQARRQRPPQCEPVQVIDVTARIERSQAVGGLINEYREQADDAPSLSSAAA
jgi:hypothetical protein